LIGFLLGLALTAQAAPTVPLYTPASCADPAARKTMLANPDQSPALKAMKEHSTAGVARMTLLLDRLTERAKLTKEQTANVAEKMLDSPELKKAYAEGNAMIARIMASMSEMTGKDDEADCRIAMNMRVEVPAIEVNGEKQWGAMRKVIEDEAKRLGVSLAD
jgi:hypothetical protein